MAPGDRQVDRRRFLTAAGSAAAAVGLAGCFGGSGQEETTTTTTSDGGNGTTTTTDSETTTTEGNTTTTEDGQGNQGGQGSLLRYSRGADSSTLDPQATTSGEDAKVINQIYDKLVHFEPGGSSLIAGLAEEFNLDGTTVNITLRQGATFHNGDELTADDFVATYRRFVDDSYGSFIGENQSFYGPYLLGKVQDVSADGDYSLSLELGQRYAPFLANLAVFALAVLPKSEIEGGADLANNPVGTGPFSFQQWNKGNQRIRLAANDEYWGDGPNVGEVVFEGISQNSTRAQRLDAGETDIVDGLGAQASQQVESSSNAELKRTPGMTIGYMAFNMARVEEFRDRRVRRAISHAINVKAIVENIYKGFAVQATHPLPPNVMGHNESLSPYEYDPQKAQQLLDEAGLSDGFSFELATMTNPRPYFASPTQTAQTVKSNLAQVGIDVTIDEQSWESYLTYTADGKHDACFLGWISDNGDPDNYYSPLLIPGIPPEEVPDGQDWVAFDTEGFNTGNRAAWANTEFMNLVTDGQTTYDDAQRQEIYKQASKIVHDEAPWVFMTHTEELRGVNNRVQNFTVAPIGGPFLNLVQL